MVELHYCLAVVIVIVAAAIQVSSAFTAVPQTFRASTKTIQKRYYKQIVLELFSPQQQQDVDDNIDPTSLRERAAQLRSEAKVK